MGDKCDSHDKCFDRVYNTVESLGDKVDAGFARVTEQLTKGAILHEKLLLLIDQREKEHAEFKDRMEGEIHRLKNTGRVDWAGQGVMLARGLIEKGILIAAAMIWYAAQNGWGK